MMVRFVVWIACVCCIGCGPSERDQRIAEAPLSSQDSSPRTSLPTEEELQDMSLEEVQAILDNDRSQEAWELLDQKEMQIARDQLGNSTLDEITERLKAEPNDRVGMKMYILKVEKLASDSLDNDPEKSFDLISQGLAFFVEQMNNVNPDLAAKFYRLQTEKWDPILEKAEAAMLAGND